eukprot:5901358-Prymnesium_polylepis.3
MACLDSMRPGVASLDAAARASSEVSARVPPRSEGDGGSGGGSGAGERCEEPTAIWAVWVRALWLRARSRDCSRYDLR